jgi:hypothetical protein
VLNCCCCLDAVALALALAITQAVPLAVAVSLAIAIALALAVVVGPHRATGMPSPLRPRFALTITVNKNCHCRHQRWQLPTAKMTAIAAATIDRLHSAAQLMMATTIAASTFFRRRHCRQCHRIVVALVVSPLNLLPPLSPSPIHYLIVVCHHQCLSPLAILAQNATVVHHHRLCSQHVANMMPICQQVMCWPNISSTPANSFFCHVADMLGNISATCQPDKHMSVVLTPFWHTNIQQSQQT